MLEAVPNVSEGRDARPIAEIGHAFASRATLLDVHSDADHHRSVFTLVGEAPALVESLVAGIARGAASSSTCARTTACIPRVGAVDVVPLVPSYPSEMALAEDGCARRRRPRSAPSSSSPSSCTATVGDGRRPAFFRARRPRRARAAHGRGRARAGRRPVEIDPRSGAVLVGARPPLVAYNVDLATDDVAVARAIAASMRESGGGMPGVQAIGLELPGSRARPGEHERPRPGAGAAARGRGASARGGGLRAASRCVGGELVGLVPERVLATRRAAGVAIPGVDESRVLERALASARL